MNTTTPAESHFHCSAEWHLAKLSSVCAIVYPFALRISKTYQKFTCSAKSVAEYFDYEERAIRRAYKELEELGLFVRIETGFFEANVFKVLTHKDWATENPNRCTTKIEFPWTGEGDPLGQKLWIASGARVKFKEYQIKFLRDLGLPENEIVGEFESFWAKEYAKTHANQYKTNRKGIVGRFILHMKAKAQSRAAAA